MKYDNKKRIIISGMPLYRLFFLACVALFVMAFFPVAVYADTEAEAEVVRVGYYENEVFQEGAREGDVNCRPCRLK